jgi:hypothetical protein
MAGSFSRSFSKIERSLVFRPARMRGPTHLGPNGTLQVGLSLSHSSDVL